MRLLEIIKPRICEERRLFAVQLFIILCNRYCYIAYAEMAKIERKLFAGWKSLLRFHNRQRNYSNESEGIKCYGFTYYPRFPNEKDPPYEPSKLFMVQRIKPLPGVVNWQKHILKQLGLDVKQSDIAIVKNIPENNVRLWRVKHLVKITPITFPNGLPKDGDYNGTYLTEHGELLVSPRLKVDEKCITAAEEYKNDRKKLDRTTIAKVLRHRWLDGWSA